MHRRVPYATRQHRRGKAGRSALIAGVICIVWLTGCTFEPDKQDTADATDTSAGQLDSNDFDLVDKPKPSIKCDPTKGNVALKVCCDINPGIQQGTKPADYFIDIDWQDGSNSTSVSPDALVGVCHEFVYKGIFGPKLTVKWKKNIKLAGEADTSIEAIQPSALSVSNVQLLSKELVATGDEVKLSFVLTNSGDEVSNPFATGVFLSKDDKVDASDILIHEIQHASIASGLSAPVVIEYPETAPVAFTLKNLPDGSQIPDDSYFLIIKVDHKDSVGEINKLDNERFAGSLLEIDNGVYLKPDVTVTPPEIVGVAASYSPNDNITYRLKVGNKGQGEAKNFKFGVWLSKNKVINVNPNPAKVDISQWDIELTDSATSKFTTLLPAASLPITRGFVVPDIPDGTYWLIAKIDSEDQLVEEQEDNNIAVGVEPLQIKLVEQQGIDLVLNEIVVKPKGTYLEGSVSISYSITSSGSVASPACKGRVYFCKGALSPAACPVNQTTFDVPAIAKNDTHNGLQIVKINKGTPVGDYNVFVLIDVEQTVDELNEGNNNKKYPPSDGQKLIITSQKSVDLTVSAVGFHPDKLKAGDDLKVGYKVSNLKTSGTSAFKVYILASPDAAISAAGVAQGKDFVMSTVVDPGVEALETVFRNNTIVVPKGLDHTIKEWYVGVWVDAEDDITGETSESNNIAAASKALIVEDPQGGCYEDGFDKDDKEDNNDDKARAVALKLGDNKDLASCGDEDWYTIAATKGHSLFVELDAAPILWTTPIASDLDIDIYTPSGKLLGSAKGLGLLKKVAALTVPEQGDYLIRVYPHTANVQAHYALKIKVQAPPSGVDLFASSMTAGPPSVFRGALLKTRLGLTNLGNDKSAAFSIDYFLSADTKLDKDDVKVFTESVTTGLGGAESLSLNKNIVLPDNSKGGKYYVIANVDAAGKINEKDETNNTVTSNSIVVNDSQTCAKDSYSGNHTIDAAARLDPETQELKDLNVCPGLEDWFYFDMPVGKALTVELLWTHKSPNGIIGVQVVDSTGTGIIAGAANPFNSVATLPYLQVGGRYYLHTYVLPEFNGQPTPHPYGIKITVAEPDPSDVCKADVYESNNSSDAAKEIGCGLANLSLCLGDEDWFFIELDKDEEVKFILDQDAATFVLQLYDNPKLKPTHKLTGSGELAFKAPKSGKFYLQTVYQTGAKKPVKFTYSLKVDGGKGIDIIPTILSLYPTKATEDESVALESVVSNECKTDAPAFHVGYYFSDDAVWDKDDLLLAERAMPALAGKKQATVYDKVVIPFGAKVGKRHLLVKVDSREAIPESQELNNFDSEELSVVEACQPDAFEPNFDLAHAATLTDARTEGLTLCPGEKDYYKVWAKKGETLTLTLDFKQSDGDLDMRLYERVGGQIVLRATSSTKVAPEQVSVTAAQDTMYYVRIDGFAGAWNRYTLLKCAAVGSKCVECLTKATCGGEDVCRDTKCQPLGCEVGVAKTCDDGNTCTLGTCVKDWGCTFDKLEGVECTDGNLCTMGHTCDAGGTCVASLAQGVTPSVWDDRGVAGDMVSLAANTERLYVGSWLDAHDGKLKGRMELFGGGGGLPFWRVGYSESDHVAQQLGSAVTVTGYDELIAVGWVDLAMTATPATVAMAGQATNTAGWVLRVAGDTGMVTHSLVLGDGLASRGALRRLARQPDGSLAAVGWATADKAADGRDAWIVYLAARATQTMAQVRWGDAGDDVFTDIVATGGGNLVASGIDRDAAGKGVGVLVGFDGTGKSQWTAKLTLDKFETALWALSRDASGGLLAGGGTDIGQAGGSPPHYKGWLVWMAPGKPGEQPQMLGNLILDPSTPQDKDYKGAAIATVQAVWARTDGGVVAAGEIGARSGAKGLTDAAVWRVGVDRKLEAMASWGGAGRDTFSAVSWSYGQMRAFGTRDVDAGGPHWYSVRDTPLKSDCNDGNACTADTCDAKAGCAYAPVADGTACDANNVCKAGACIAK